MKRTILTLLAAVLVLPSVAWGAPILQTARTPDWTVHTITFDGTTDDSPAFGISTNCAIRAVTYGGSGTATIYQVPTSTTATGSGTSLAAFTAVSTATTEVNPGQRYGRASGASDGTIVEVACSNVMVASGGSISVFTGGENDVADRANPNDMDGDHTYDNALACSGQCFFQSSSTYGGGWWSWDGNDWAPLNERIVYKHRFQGGQTNWVTDSWTHINCWFGSGQGAGDDDDEATCDDEEAAVGFTKHWLSRWVFVPAGDSDNGDACDLRMIEGAPADAAATTTQAVTETLFTVGDAAYTEGAPVYSSINVEIDAEGYYFQLRNAGGGTGCVTGSSCECGAFVNGEFILYGWPRA